MNEVHAVASKVCTACGARYPDDALFCPADGSPLQSAAAAGRAPDDPYLGQEISGHIEIRQLVGIGAMGRVYRAFQRGIDRDVAVKILHRELSANAQLVSRFTREAKVASRLQHPNVVQVLLAGQLPDRALYMVMEYLDGLSLQSALAAAGGALPLTRALHVALQLCEAVGEAHVQGIVHRDLKPENVMLVRRGRDSDFVKVLDFGIARINWGEQSVATAAGLIFGTARYISPEGAQGNAVEPASDVYSIATLLYQMLSGRTPFEAEQAVALLVQQIHDPPPPLRSIERASFVPEAIADVVMRNLAKDPAAREPDARALGHAIVSAAKQAGLSLEDLSRPGLRKAAAAMQLPPMQRTNKLDLGPEVAERSSPPPPAGNGARAPMGETVKWEPPSEFAARLAEARTPAPRVDETLDDASLVEAFPSVDKTLPGEDEPDVRESARVRATAYATPASEPALPRQASRPSYPSRPSAPSAPSRPSLQSQPAVEEEDRPRRSRGLLFVALCFVLGAALAAGVAWKMGKLGPAGDGEARAVARATDAMFRKHFDEPPGDNVKDITDEALRRWPNDRKLLDVRVRAADELVTQALAQRAAGDVAEALRLARVARELDPNSASAGRLAEQYARELESFTAPTSPTLDRPPPAPPEPKAHAASAAPRPKPTRAPAPSYKVLLEVSARHAHVGQTVKLTARVAPPKGALESPSFAITGPGLGDGAKMAALGGEPGVYEGSYVFLEPGKFQVTFTVEAEGKGLRAARAVVVARPDQPEPPATSKPPATAPTPSVKWM